MKAFRTLAVLCALSTAGLPGASAQMASPPANPYVPTSGQAGKDVVWVPTPQALVDTMLNMAAITPQDYLIDLGSGDGRTVITAAKRGTRALGIEYNSDMVAISQRAAEKEGATDKATFRQADIFQTNFSDATVLTLFLLPSLNVKLRPTILDMKPGTRVVSNSFTMDDWQPDETMEVKENCTSYCRAYKWIVPAKVEGAWKLGDGELKLAQKYQMLTGSLTVGGKASEISDAKMNGAQISFTADGKRYTGRVEGDKITGTTEAGGSKQDFSASRVSAG